MDKNVFFPSLPLRDIVVFPGMIAPLFVGREKSINALNEVMKANKKIVLITQKNAEKDDPTEKDLYSFGCESKVLQLLKLPDGTVHAAHSCFKIPDPFLQHGYGLLRLWRHFFLKRTGY